MDPHDVTCPYHCTRTCAPMMLRDLSLHTHMFRCTPTHADTDTHRYTLHVPVYPSMMCQVHARVDRQVPSPHVPSPIVHDHVNADNRHTDVRTTSWTAHAWMTDAHAHLYACTLHPGSCMHPGGHYRSTDLYTGSPRLLSLTCTVHVYIYLHAQQPTHQGRARCARPKHG